MAIKVNTLTEYVDQRKDELLTKAVLGANTLNHVEIMPDVKYKSALNYLDSTIVLADGSAKVKYRGALWRRSDRRGLDGCKWRGQHLYSPGVSAPVVAGVPVFVRCPAAHGR